MTRLGYAVRVCYVAAAWLFVAGVQGQAFLAGLALFVGPGTWASHRELGHSIAILPLLLLLLAWRGRLPRPAVRQAALLFGVYVVQAELFAAVRRQIPTLAALHPVLALLLFTVGVAVARHAWSTLRRQPAPAAPAADGGQLVAPQGAV